MPVLFVLQLLPSGPFFLLVLTLPLSPSLSFYSLESTLTVSLRVTFPHGGTIGSMEFPSLLLAVPSQKPESGPL